MKDGRTVGWKADELILALSDHIPKEREVSTTTLDSWRGGKTFPQGAHENALFRVFWPSGPRADRTSFEKLRDDLAAAKAAHKVLQRSEIRNRLQPAIDELHLTNPTRFAPSGPSVADSLKYDVERDVFVGRPDDLALLHQLVDPEAIAAERKPVLWQLVTGPGGQGKSRLALQFMRYAIELGWHAGFLSESALGRLDPSRWRPERSTLIIIDYPASQAERLRVVFAELARFGEEFVFPVRVLLLERSAEREWYGRFQPPTTDGDAVRRIQYGPPHELSPLQRCDLLALMRGRLPEGGISLSDEHLLDMLLVVDSTQSTQGEHIQWEPRPLFAAATAEILAAGADVFLTRLAVLDYILDREEHLWQIAAHGRPQALRSHKALLALSSATLGLATKAIFSLDILPKILPSFWGNDGRESIDFDLFAAMVGYRDRNLFHSLEPDMLGERFVLRYLENNIGINEAFVCAAWQMGDVNMGTFVLRAVADFPNSASLGPLFEVGHTTDRVGYVFCWTAVDLLGRLVGNIKSGHRDTVWRQVRELVATYDRADLRLEASKAAYNLTLHLCETGDLEGAIVALEWLQNLIELKGEADVRRFTAKAAGVVIRKLSEGRMLEKAREHFRWLRDIVDRHKEPDVRMSGAQAAFQLALLEGNEGDVSIAKDTVGWLQLISDEFNEPAVQSLAAKATYNLLLRLDKPDDYDASDAMVKWLRTTADHSNIGENRELAAEGVRIFVSRLANKKQKYK